MRIGRRIVPVRASGCLVGRRIVEQQQLLCLQCNHSVCPAAVVGKRDVVDARRPDLNDPADLAANQALAWHILEQRDYRMHPNIRHRWTFFL
jgi:hypothetical protein